MLRAAAGAEGVLWWASGDGSKALQHGREGAEGQRQQEVLHHSAADSRAVGRSETRQRDMGDEGTRDGWGGARGVGMMGKTMGRVETRQLKAAVVTQESSVYERLLCGLHLCGHAVQHLPLLVFCACHPD
jgi:hypothetical protein